MRKPVSRRVVLAGIGAAALIGGGAVAMRSIVARTRSADAEAAEYATLLADVHDDYVNGRVVEHHGWVLSQHEFDTIEARKTDRDAASPAAIS